jgi:hypothetical protein
LITYGKSDIPKTGMFTVALPTMQELRIKKVFKTEIKNFFISLLFWDYKFSEIIEDLEISETSNRVNVLSGATLYEFEMFFHVWTSFKALTVL